MVSSRAFDYEYDCSPQALVDRYQGREVGPNPDVMGTGVLIGFAGSTTLAVLLLIFKYIYTHEPATSPFSCDDRSGVDAGVHNRHTCHSCSQWKPNSIDVEVLSFIRRWAKIPDRGIRSRTARIVDECVLEMCDVQAITGMAILVSGFLSLCHPEAPLTAADWQTLVYLAWFSASTHLAGLTCLRAYLNERPRLKLSRISLMLCLLIWLIVAMIPTGFFDWRTFKRGYDGELPAPLSPAVCYFDLSTAKTLWKFAQVQRYPWNRNPSLMEKGSMQSMIMGVVVLLVGFATRCVKLSPALSHKVQLYTRDPIRSGMRSLLTSATRWIEDPTKGTPSPEPHSSQIWIDLVLLPGTGLYLCLRWTAAMYSSMLAEIIWIILVAAWGMVKLLANRILTVDEQLGPDLAGFHTWSFGQIIAIVLLLSPVFSIARKFLEDPRPEELQEARDYDRETPGDALEQGAAFHDTPHHTPEAWPVRCHEKENEEATESPTAPTTQQDIVQTTNQAKLDIIDQLLYPGSPAVPRRWVSTCCALAGSYWLVVAGIASGYTNNNIVLHGARTWATGCSTMSNMVDFWITYFGTLFFLLFCYPAATALTAALGIQLEVFYKRHRASVPVPTRAMAVFFMSWLAVQIGTFCVQFRWVYHYGFYLPSWAKAPVLAILYYAVYASLCVGFSLAHARDSSSRATQDQYAT
ncbi:hypothetical protein Micbo1qcDRAFT_221312 [Microdochium bolleyi]|uniref:Uncharacterized protein n=1 Tax=Microdochium bolleyi TaxID=196109 RepID=A0A136JCE6_9PEZI|nr:hypothetical protein Micbo1qcDRAFT_221312 [Microdochium bolleyi]